MPVLKLEPQLAPHVTKVQKAEGRAFESRLGTRFPELEPGFLLTPAKPPFLTVTFSISMLTGPPPGASLLVPVAPTYLYLRSAASASPRSTAHYRHRPWPLSGPSHAGSGQVRLVRRSGLFRGISRPGPGGRGGRSGHANQLQVTLLSAT